VKVAERSGQTDDHALAHDPRYSPLSGCPRYSTRPADHDFTKHIGSWLDRLVGILAGRAASGSTGLQPDGLL
jgi:hypothetical protein